MQLFEILAIVTQACTANRFAAKVSKAAECQMLALSGMGNDKTKFAFNQDGQDPVRAKNKCQNKKTAIFLERGSGKPPEAVAFCFCF